MTLIVSIFPTAIGQDFVKDRHVGGGPAQHVEIMGRTPVELFVLEGLRFAGEDAAIVRPQADHSFVVVPDDRAEWGADFDIDSELFAQLADKRGLGAFSALHFAAWEFPEAAEVFTHGSQTGENVPFQIFDHAANDLYHAVDSG